MRGKIHSSCSRQKFKISSKRRRLKQSSVSWQLCVGTVSHYQTFTCSKPWLSKGTSHGDTKVVFWKIRRSLANSDCLLALAEIWTHFSVERRLWVPPPIYYTVVAQESECHIELELGGTEPLRQQQVLVNLCLPVILYVICDLGRPAWIIS